MRTYNVVSYQDPLETVEGVVPENASLGIVAKEGFVMDYRFFGDAFTRKIITIKKGDFTQKSDAAAWIICSFRPIIQACPFQNLIA